MKYNHKEITADGIKFKSMLEWEVYLFLKDKSVSPLRYEKERFKIVGETTEYFPNGGRRKSSGCYYTPDFIFNYRGQKIIIEVKGYATDIYRLRKKIFIDKYPILSLNFFEIKNIVDLESVFSLIDDRLRIAKARGM